MFLIFLLNRLYRSWILLFISNIVFILKNNFNRIGFCIIKIRQVFDMNVFQLIGFCCNNYRLTKLSVTFIVISGFFWYQWKLLTFTCLLLTLTFIVSRNLLFALTWLISKRKFLIHISFRNLIHKFYWFFKKRTSSIFYIFFWFLKQRQFFW